MPLILSIVLAFLATSAAGVVFLYAVRSRRHLSGEASQHVRQASHRPMQTVH